MASVNNTTTITNFNCASCGKVGGNLNMCNKCNMVKYCNAACKKKHRSKHKKACEKRVSELHDDALFKEHPPREDCPICFLPLPLDPGQTNFHPCCGKIICNGCIYAMKEEACGRGKIELCAFCREPEPSSAEEATKQIKKLMEADNADAFHNLAGYYEDGIKGMPQDFAKANELWLKAGELGCVEAYFKLGFSYNNERGVEMDKKKAMHYYELAAMSGDVHARHNLGFQEGKAGNYHRAMKHFRLAANAGYKKSLDMVKKGYMDGIVTKDEYASTIRAYHQRVDETTSDDRDKAEAAYLHLRLRALT
ncbi:zinc finger MYND domain-containing protein [bacterium]|nr:zinc finger MYND domain-containing protein [bacterium]